MELASWLSAPLFVRSLTMGKLTKAQRRFLAAHDIDADMVFNAKGLTRAQYRQRARDEGMSFVYNATPCQDFGHTLRTRRGQCIQCHPASIAFMKREQEWGDLYIVGSLSAGLFKIGFSTTTEKRVDILNYNRLAGVADWKLLFWFDNAPASAEHAVQSKLSDFRQSVIYSNASGQYTSKECYVCTYLDAKFAMLMTSMEGDICWGEHHEYEELATRYTGVNQPKPKRRRSKPSSQKSVQN